MDRNEASALADLQMHWDEAYAIGFDDEVWSARFRGSTDVLCARTSSDLRELIRADYVHRQRPRRPTQPAGQVRPACEADQDGAAAGADAAAVADAPGSADFAAIRGERMST